MDDFKNIVDELNDYFASLEKQTTEFCANDNKYVFNNLINTNARSMFLSGVHETDVVEIVRKLKNMRSLDIDSTDTVIIKDVNGYIDLGL